MQRRTPEPIGPVTDLPDAARPPAGRLTADRAADRGTDRGGSGDHRRPAVASLIATALATLVPVTVFTAAPASAAEAVSGASATVVNAHTSGTSGTVHAATDTRETAREGDLQPDASVTTPPEKVAREAPVRGPATTVQVVLADGRPEIVTHEVNGRAQAVEVIAAAQDDPDTLAVAIDRPVTLASDGTTSTISDPLRARQWGLTRLDAEDAWARSTGSGVTVAVIDTGVAKVDDLRRAVLPGTDLLDPKGDGSADTNGHGTHVAGIIAAARNNGIGVAGLAPNARILPIRVLDEDGGGRASDVCNAIVWAVDHGADVINLSFGTGSYPPLSVAVDYAIVHDVVVVAAAGNEQRRGNEPQYPAALPGVVAVGATDQDDRITTFSNTGPYLELTAPGVSVLSTFTVGYASKSGTSMSAPFVSATAALVRAAAPQATAAQVRATLDRTAIDLGSRGVDETFGYGLVDPRAAVCALAGCDGYAAAPPKASTTVGITRSVTLAYGGRTRFTATLSTRDGTALPGMPLEWCVRYADTRRTTCRATTTDATGRSGYTVRPNRRILVWARHPGSSNTLSSRSITRSVSVTPLVVTSAPGKKTLRARVKPSGVHAVVLQQRRGSRWSSIRTARTSRSGAVSFTRLATRRTYRVLVRPSSGLSSVTGTGLRVH